jgi:hypothetical protein
MTKCIILILFAALLLSTSSMASRVRIPTNQGRTLECDESDMDCWNAAHTMAEDGNEDLHIYGVREIPVLVGDPQMQLRQVQKDGVVNFFNAVGNAFAQ